MIMKKFTFLVAMLLSLTFLSCNKEDITTQLTNKDPNIRVYESTTLNMFNRASYDEPCKTTTLIAGQHHVAGTVTVDTDGDNLILTYATADGWTIGLTHFSIGNCDEQWVPTTGNGNPKVGHFEHTEPHSQDINEVVYLISLDALDEAYCFAAHAEVNGPTGGETAWARDENNILEFDGNNWATYVEALLSDCDVDGEGNDPNK